MGYKKMKCKICGKEVFAVNTGKHPRAYISLSPQGSDDVRCEEHKGELLK